MLHFQLAKKIVSSPNVSVSDSICKITSILNILRQHI